MGDKTDRELDQLLGKLASIQQVVGVEADEEQSNSAFKDDRFMAEKTAMTDTMTEIRSLLSKKQELIENHEKVELARLNDVIRRKMTVLENQTDDLDRIAKAERRKKNSKFSDVELERRQEIVEAFREEVQALKSMNRTGKASATKKLQSMGEHELFQPRRTPNAKPSMLGSRQAEQEEVTGAQQIQLQEIRAKEREQDRKIEMIGKGIEGLHDKAKGMHKELQTQKLLIDDMERQVDRAQEQLSTVNDKLKGVLAQVDRGESKFCVDIVCIVLLLGLAAILIQVARSG